MAGVVTEQVDVNSLFDVIHSFSHHLIHMHVLFRVLMVQNMSVEAVVLEDGGWGGMVTEMVVTDGYTVA